MPDSHNWQSKLVARQRAQISGYSQVRENKEEHEHGLTGDGKCNTNKRVTGP